MKRWVTGFMVCTVLIWLCVSVAWRRDQVSPPRRKPINRYVRSNPLVTRKCNMYTLRCRRSHCSQHQLDMSMVIPPSTHKFQGVISCVFRFITMFRSTYFYHFAVNDMKFKLISINFYTVLYVCTITYCKASIIERVVPPPPPNPLKPNTFAQL